MGKGERRWRPRRRVRERSGSGRASAASGATPTSSSSGPAQSVSLFGSEITTLALPLTAALALGATPVQMGLLAAAGQAPFLLCSLAAGVWVDRSPRRPLLIGADLGRALLLASIPAAALLGALRIEHLYAVAFLAGVLGVVFEVAHYAYVPSLLRREQLIEGNSKLQISYSAAESGGPGVAGLLVQLASAPLTLLADAASFLVSALLLRAIAAPEAPVAQPAGRGGARREIVEGLRALLGHPLLRPIVLASATSGLFHGGVTALYVLYATRDLGIGPLALGLVFAAGGLGAIPGAVLSGRVARRFGTGPAIIWGILLGQLLLLPIPLAARFPTPAAIATLAAAQVLGGIVNTIANVNQWSLRQAVTPDHLQGRVTASHRFLVYGAPPLGALLGGFLGAAIGLGPAILLCALGALLGPLWLVCSPLRQLREQPAADDGADRHA